MILRAPEVQATKIPEDYNTTTLTIVQGFWSISLQVLLIAFPQWPTPSHIKSTPVGIGPHLVELASTSADFRPELSCSWLFWATAGSRRARCGGESRSARGYVGEHTNFLNVDLGCRTTERAIRRGGLSVAARSFERLRLKAGAAAAMCARRTGPSPADIEGEGGAHAASPAEGAKRLAALSTRWRMQNTHSEQICSRGARWVSRKHASQLLAGRLSGQKLETYPRHARALLLEPFF